MAWVVFVNADEFNAYYIQMVADVNDRDIPEMTPLRDALNLNEFELESGKHLIAKVPERDVERYGLARAQHDPVTDKRRGTVTVKWNGIDRPVTPYNPENLSDEPIEVPPSPPPEDLPEEPEPEPEPEEPPVEPEESP